tara:strand:- start:1212 stop:1778 length:567 start_codon:yes stop_codon:yes gene_type:complete
MFENILNQVPNQNSQEPWLISRYEAWRKEQLEKAKRQAIAAGDQIATTGSNLLAPTGEHEARLAEEGEAVLQGRVEDRLAAQDQARAWEEDAGGLPTRDITSQGDVAQLLGIDRKEVPAYLGGTPKEKEKKEMDLMEQAFLMTMMENMRGEDIGQAPAVVAGGGQRQWPSMMGQFAPWEQQKPYWWVA